MLDCQREASTIVAPEATYEPIIPGARGRLWDFPGYLGCQYCVALPLRGAVRGQNRPLGR